MRALLFTLPVYMYKFFNSTVSYLVCFNVGYVNCYPCCRWVVIPDVLIVGGLIVDANLSLLLLRLLT